MRPRAWIVLSLLIVHATTSHAESRALAAARVAYAEFEYNKVLPLLSRALTETADEGEIIAIHELEAKMYVMYGREEMGQKSFVRILSIRPDWRPDALESPKVQRVFKLASAEMARRAAAAPAEKTQAPSDGPAPPSKSAAPSKSAPPSKSASAPPSKSAATLPDSAPATIPSTRVAAADDGPVYHRWWFWAAIGVGAAAIVGGTAAAFATQRSAPPHDLGPYTVGN